MPQCINEDERIHRPTISWLLEKRHYGRHSEVWIRPVDGMDPLCFRAKGNGKVRMNDRRFIVIVTLEVFLVRSFIQGIPF